MPLWLLLACLCLCATPRAALTVLESEADLLAPARALSPGGAPPPPPSPLYPAAAIARLHAELAALQHPASCASARVLLVRYSAEAGVNGFAAMFQFVAGALAVARALNRTLIEAHPLPLQAAAAAHPDPWLRAPQAACGGLKLGCFLAPLSPCGALGWGGLGEGVPEAAGTLAGARAQASAPALALTSLAPHHALLFAAARGSGPGAPPWWPAAVGPAACVYQGRQRSASACARRLYFAAVQAYAFRPLPRLAGPAAALAARMAAAGASGAPVLAVHVRRGDAAALAWRSSAGLEAYLAAAAAGVAGEAAGRALEQAEAAWEAAGGLAEAGVEAGGERAGAAEAAAQQQQPNARSLMYLATDSAQVRARASEAGWAAGFEVLPPPDTAGALLQGGAGGDEVHAHTESVIARTLQEQGLLPAMWQGGAASASGGGSAPQPQPAPARLPPLQQYLPPAAYLALTTGNRSAFVAAHAAAAAAGAPAHAEAAAAAAAADAAAAHAAFSVLALTDAVVTDIYALSHGTHFVGTCLSQVSRVAYDLAYAAGRARAAPVGLDAARCRAHPVHFFPVAADWREGFDAWADA